MTTYTITNLLLTGADVDVENEVVTATCDVALDGADSQNIMLRCDPADPDAIRSAVLTYVRDQLAQQTPADPISSEVQQILGTPLTVD